MLHTLDFIAKLYLNVFYIAYQVKFIIYISVVAYITTISI